MRHLIGEYGADIADGDVFIGNDPISLRASTCPISMRSGRSSMPARSTAGQPRLPTMSMSAASCPAAIR
jgi:hypothetical protein